MVELLLVHMKENDTVGKKIRDSYRLPFHPSTGDGNPMCYFKLTVGYFRVC